MQKQTTKSKALLAAGAFALVLVAAAAMTFLSGNALSAKVSRSSQNTGGSSITTNKKTPAICPTYAAPPPDWCANGTIVPQPKDAKGCLVPPKCVEATTTCRVCDGGTVTEEKDSAGCPVYICPVIACPAYSPPAPDWCANGTIVPQPKDAKGCAVPAKCVEATTACSACVGGTATDEKDSSGCPVYICPTTTNEDDKETSESSSDTKKSVGRFFNWSCEDSDGGINAEQKGTVTTVFRVLKKEFSKQYTDKNHGKNGIVEYYCDNNKVRSKVIKCENSPTDGACQSGTPVPVPTSLNITVTGDTPPSDILVAGANAVSLTKFNITSTKNVVINQLQVTNSGNDENIISLILHDDDSQKNASLTNHVATFSGLNLAIPANGQKTVKIEANLNPIASGAVSGGKIKIGLLADGFKATESVAATTINNPGFTGTLWGNEMTVYETKPMLSLAPSSPSGSRTTSIADEVFAFNVVASITEAVRLNQIKISLDSDASFSSAGDESEHAAYLKEGGSTVATGTVQIQDASHGSVTFTFPSANPVEITKAMSKTFSLQLNTANLISSEAAKDDLFTPSIFLGNATTEGGFWWSDTNIDNIKWIGYVGYKTPGDSTLIGNTLKY